MLEMSCITSGLTMFKTPVFKSFKLRIYNFYSYFRLPNRQILCFISVGLFFGSFRIGSSLLEFLKLWLPHCLDRKTTKQERDWLLPLSASTIHLFLQASPCAYPHLEAPPVSLFAARLTSGVGAVLICITSDGWPFASCLKGHCRIDKHTT